MTAGHLTSNHVNYLIWRYLQESGHGEAAVKLQRDWISDPQSLPFAQHIRTHALVGLMQKGLLYHDIERSVDEHGNRRSPPDSTLFFGPETATATSIAKQEQSEEDSTASRLSPHSRKHGREITSNGLLLHLPAQEPSAKRNRRSNGTDASTNGDHRGSDRMEIDHHMDFRNEPAEPISRSHSPTEESQTGAEGAGMDVDDDAPAPDPTLTNGQSVGVQSDKVQVLGPEAILPIPNTSVMHAAWNPRHPTILATGGDALCRIWILLPGQAPGSSSFRSISYVDLLDSKNDLFVSAMSWSPDGEMLAVASRSGPSDLTGDISVWSKNGKSLENLSAPRDMILLLRWNLQGSQLLGVTCAGNGQSAILIWDLRSAQAARPHPINNDIRDAAWTGDGGVLICGNGMIAKSHYDSQGIVAFSPCSSQAWVSDRRWTHVLFDPVSEIIAVAAEEDAHLCVIDAYGGANQVKAHDAEITAIAYQPLSNTSPPLPGAPRLLATASLDGTVKIRDARNPLSTLHTLRLSHSSPAMAIAFSSDGYLLATASPNSVLIWNPESSGMPRASWKGEMSRWQSLTNGMDRDSGIGEEEEGSIPSLSWDLNTERLAYGLGDKIAIIPAVPG